MLRLLLLQKWQNNVLAACYICFSFIRPKYASLSMIKSPTGVLRDNRRRFFNFCVPDLRYGDNRVSYKRRFVSTLARG